MLKFKSHVNTCANRVNKIWKLWKGEVWELWLVIPPGDATQDLLLLCLGPSSLMSLVLWNNET